MSAVAVVEIFHCHIGIPHVGCYMFATGKLYMSKRRNKKYKIWESIMGTLVR